MTKAKPFLLDTNIFIQAKRSYYAFAICPGYWKSLIGHYHAGNVRSIDSVKVEIMRGKDDLADWVKNDVPDGFFQTTQEQNVATYYQQLITWVHKNPQFNQDAKDEFASAADGWLVAYAWANDCVVVSHEAWIPDVKNRVPIPNLCKQFGLKCEDTFTMLKSLNIQFDWSGENKAEHIQ